MKGENLPRIGARSRHAAIGFVGVAAAVIAALLAGGSRGAPTVEDVTRVVELPSAAGSPRTDLRPDDVARVLRSRVRVPAGRTPAGTFLVGAARVRLDPAPRRFGGTTWMREGCTALTDGVVDGDHLLPPPDDAVDELRSWPASSPDCIYLGGFGVGPVRPAESVGPGGVWVRAMAISNGARTFVYEIADLVGWFARYDTTVCTDCGILDVRRRVGREIGVDARERRHRIDALARISRHVRRLGWHPRLVQEPDQRLRDRSSEAGRR